MNGVIEDGDLEGIKDTVERYMRSALRGERPKFPSKSFGAFVRYLSPEERSEFILNIIRTESEMWRQQEEDLGLDTVLEITQWISKEKMLPVRVVCKVERETEKAYFIVTPEGECWMPKSQVISKEDLKCTVQSKL